MYLCIVSFVLAGMVAMGGCFAEPRHVRVDPARPDEAVVTISPGKAGEITRGTGWFVWLRYCTTASSAANITAMSRWTDAQWDAYLKLLVESGADWVRVDLNYADVEPRNDDGDPEHINWEGFKFDSPALRGLYKTLDCCQANGIQVSLTNIYALSPQTYLADPPSGWMSKRALASGFRNPESFGNPRGDGPIDPRELAENLAATAYHLIKKRGYTCIKDLCLYAEPNYAWTNVDCWGDTKLLGKALQKLGIRDQVSVYGPYDFGPQAGDFQKTYKEGYLRSDVDVLGNSEYWIHPSADNPAASAISKYGQLMDVVRPLAAERGRKVEFTLAEYGDWGTGSYQIKADGPLPSYLGTLAESGMIFDLYGIGYAGALRWSFAPWYQPNDGFAAIRTEGVAYPATSDEKSNESVYTLLAEAWKKGAKCVKVPQTFEPQRLVNSNLRRGSTVYKAAVVGPKASGIHAIAVRDKAGKWRVGLINLHQQEVVVRLQMPAKGLPNWRRWEFYDASLGDRCRQGDTPSFEGTSCRFVLPAQSIGFLTED